MLNYYCQINTHITEKHANIHIFSIKLFIRCLYKVVCRMRNPILKG